MTTKTFNAADYAYIDKLKSFTSTYNDLKKYGITDDETLDAVLSGFLHTFPDTVTPEPAPAIPTFGSTTGRYSNTAPNLREIPLPGVDLRKILGYVILNKTTGGLSSNFYKQLFLSADAADTALTDFLSDEQGLGIFQIGTAKKNYEIVPVSKNQMT